MKRLYSEQSLKQAVNDISNKLMTLRKAAKFYKIPFSTLQRKVQNGGETTYKKPGTKPKLNKQMEEMIKAEIQKCHNEEQKMSKKNVPTYLKFTRNSYSIRVTYF